MTRVVHFTHHLCRVVDGNAPHEYEAHKRAERSWSDQPSPMFSGCIPRGRGVVRPRYTTNRAEVTCKTCLREPYWRSEQARKSAEWQAIPAAGRDAELVNRAWIVCCRARGVPSPLSREYVDALEMRTRRAQASIFGDLGAHVFSAVAGGGSSAARLRAEIEDIAGRVDVDIREAARKAIDEWLLAADVLDIVDQCIARANQATSELGRYVETRGPTGADSAFARLPPESPESILRLLFAKRTDDAEAN